jgi:hypothetical protein
LGIEVLCEGGTPVRLQALEDVLQAVVEPVYAALASIPFTLVKSHGRPSVVAIPRTFNGSRT